MSIKTTNYQKNQTSKMTHGTTQTTAKLPKHIGPLLLNKVAVTKQWRTTYLMTTNATVAFVTVENATSPRADSPVHTVKPDFGAYHNPNKPSDWYSPKIAARKKRFQVSFKTHLVDCASKEFINAISSAPAIPNANPARKSISDATGTWRGQGPLPTCSRSVKSPKRDKKRSLDSYQFPRTRNVTDVQNRTDPATEKRRVLNATTTLNFATLADHKDWVSSLLVWDANNSAVDGTATAAGRAKDAFLEKGVAPTRPRTDWYHEHTEFLVVRFQLVAMGICRKEIHPRKNAFDVNARDTTATENNRATPVWRNFVPIRMPTATIENLMEP
jgi:hypothetical protein